MDQNLDMLVRLQRIDSTIDSLTRRKEKYPDQMTILESEVASAEQDLKVRQEERNELEKEQRHFERELQNVNFELDKHQKRLFEVKTNKEYQALLKEIEAQKTKIEEFEGQILEHMTALDDVSDQMKKFEGAFAQQKEEASRTIQKLKGELASVEEELTVQQRARETLIAGIGDRLLRTYEKVRKRNRGLGVVPVLKEACGGCFERLPPQRINEIRRKEELIFCENCGCILIWDEEGFLNTLRNEKNRKEGPEQNR